MPSQQITQHLYGDKPVRAVALDGALWFAAKDVAEALGIVWQGEKTLAKIKPEWKRQARVPAAKGGVENATPLNEQSTYLVNRNGALKLAFRSNKAEAERFTDWLAGEVIPAIYDTGRYEDSAAQAPAQPARRPHVGDKELARHARRVRHAKFALVEATMRLSALGVDAAAIDMRDVVAFGRRLSTMGVR